MSLFRPVFISSGYITLGCTGSNFLPATGNHVIASIRWSLFGQVFTWPGKGFIKGGVSQVLVHYALRPVCLCVDGK